MFAMIVGSVDWNSALVLCVLFIVIGVVATGLVAKRRSRMELEMQFKVDMQKLANEDKDKERVNQRAAEFELMKLSTEKDIQFRRIETGLIEGSKVVS